MRSAIRAAWVLILVLSPLVLLHGHEAASQTFSRPQWTDIYWFHAAAGISPDSGVAHGDASVVGDRKDLYFRYQPKWFGLIVGYHSNRFYSALDQESFNVDNSVYSVGPSLRTLLVEDGAGAWGGLHLVWHLLFQRGRSDAHAFNGPAGGPHTEVAADIYHADGFAGGVDALVPLVWGTWVSAGVGLENLGFQYQVPTDPNGDGRVNIRRTFSYLRAGLAVSF